MGHINVNLSIVYASRNPTSPGQNSRSRVVGCRSWYELICHSSSYFNTTKGEMRVCHQLPPSPIPLPPRRSQKVFVFIFHPVIPACGMKKFQDFTPTITTGRRCATWWEQGLRSVNGCRCIAIEQGGGFFQLVVIREGGIRLSLSLSESNVGCHCHRTGWRLFSIGRH